MLSIRLNWSHLVLPLSLASQLTHVVEGQQKGATKEANKKKFLK